MKCLMIHPEYVGQILDGEKTVEYRSWSTPYRGDFFIGVTATREHNSFISVVASLNSIAYSEKRGVYEWHLSNIREIKPIPVKGRQRLFETGIDEYETTDDLTDEEYEKVWNEADQWILKKRSV